MAIDWQTQWQLTALPSSLLELILIPSTSTDDKRVLRLVCKVFQQVLDGSLVSTRLKLNCCSYSTGQQCFDHLMDRFQHACGMRAMELWSWEPTGIRINNLPTTLKTLKIYGGDHATNLNLRVMGNLPHLTSLSLGSITVTEMEHVSRLTHLYCDTFLGSVAHLAPSLQHLQIRDFRHVQNMEQLTCLKSLQVAENMPTNFFKEHCRMPLEQLFFSTSDSCKGFIDNTDAWQSAPSTLVRLAICNTHHCVLPCVLPASVTHLQLLFPDRRHVEQAANALQGLKRLDLTMHAQNWSGARCVCSHLSKLPNLQSLGIYMAVDYRVVERCQILSAIPDVARAVASGLELIVTKDRHELLGVFQHPWAYSATSSWV